jgi:hypothetical protein
MSQLVQGMRAGLPVRFPGFKAQPEPLSARTVAATRSALTGSKLAWRHSAALTGPAVVASVAYMDPGNFATNIQAGSRYGYDLLWVVVLANLLAMLFQALSAKLGLVTGRNLAELCRDRLRRRWCGRCGSSARLRRWQPISPNSSAVRSACR